MEGARSDSVKIEMVWKGTSFNGSTVATAATIRAAVEVTLQLLLEIPAARDIERVVTQPGSPWAPEEQRTVGTLTITAPARRKDAWATLTWGGRHGTGTLRTRHEDWRIGLRDVLAHLMRGSLRQLDEALCLIESGARRRIGFQLFGTSAEIRVSSGH
jgi:hypothetical protein